MRMKKEAVKDILQILLGSLLFAVSLNVFLIPVHVYSAGFMGIAQLLRDFVSVCSGIQFPFDIAGSINFLLNILIFVFAFRYVSRRFAIMTLLTIAVQSLMLSLLPIQQELLLQDPLVSILFGSVLCAIATVITFNGKGSGGGIDVIGIYLSQHNKGSVGRIYMLVNTSVYLICLVFYDFETAVYSMISSTLLSFAVDRIHKRNIEVEIMVFTENSTELRKELLASSERGITCWSGYGAYTESKKDVLLSVVTRDQMQTFVRRVQTIDPKAFVIVSSQIQVYGNFQKQIV